MKSSIKALIVLCAAGASSVGFADIIFVNNQQYTSASQGTDQSTPFFHFQAMAGFGSLIEPQADYDPMGQFTRTRADISTTGTGNATNFTINGHVDSLAAAATGTFFNQFLADSYSKEFVNFYTDAPAILTFTSSNGQTSNNNAFWNYLQVNVDGYAFNLYGPAGTTYSTFVYGGSHSFLIQSNSKAAAGGMAPIQYGPSSQASFSTDYTFNIHNTPEPTTMILMAAGFAMLRRRRRAKV